MTIPHRDRILHIARLHGMRNVRVFGSVARGEATAHDLDLLVDAAPDRTLLDFVRFWQQVEELVGHRVDVVADGGISPYLQERIYSEAKPL